MKPILSEKNIVVVLFVMVLVTFSLAQEDSKKMEKGFTSMSTVSANRFMVDHAARPSAPEDTKVQPAN